MTILVKIAILICFVRNNVELNIKWNMTENNDIFNMLSYPILILVRDWYPHLEIFRPLMFSLSFSVTKVQLLSFTRYLNSRWLTYGRKPWDDRLVPHMTYDLHLAHIFHQCFSIIAHQLFGHSDFYKLKNCRLDNGDNDRSKSNIIFYLMHSFRNSSAIIQV